MAGEIERGVKPSAITIQVPFGITAWSALPLSGKLAAPTFAFSRTILTSTSSVVAKTTLRIRCATSSATAKKPG